MIKKKIRFFSCCQRLEIEKKTPLNLAVFLAFIIQLSLGDKYNFQGKIGGCFLMGKKASSLNGGKYKMVNVNVGEERAEINKTDVFFELSR